MVQSVGRVSSGVQRDEVLACTVAVVVMDCYSRPVNGKLFKVWSSMTIYLGVKVREDTTLEKWVFCEVNPTDDVAGLELSIGLAKLTREVYSSH